MKVLVVDDERLARERLMRMVGSLDDYHVVGDAARGEDAIDKTMSLEPDIVLLDIRMPGMDGISVAEKLSEIEAPPAVVFCTAYSEHALDAFDVFAAGYLLKPIRRDALVDTLTNIGRINRAQMVHIQDDAPPCKKTRTHICAKTRRGIELIPLRDIRFFLADHKYVTVRHEKGEVLIDDTLRDLELEFGDRLLRIHRNALIMTEYLDGIERDTSGHYRVRMKGIEDRLDVSRRHVSSLRRLVQLI